MRRGVGVLVIAAAIAFSGSVGRTGSGPPGDDRAVSTDGAICPGTGTVAYVDMPYEDIPGVDPNLLALDLYRPVLGDGCGPTPVMVWVHGGAWSVGDKQNKIDTKVSFFNGAGWLFVSVNYRLSPADLPRDPSDLEPDRTTYPVQEEDVATAMAWVVRHVRTFGGDPNRISLMGHSAGAGIVSALATDSRFLRAHGLDLAILRHVVSLDTAAYDIRRRIETAPPLTAMIYLNAFGTEPAAWDAASPINHVAPGKCIPPFFIVTRGSRDRVDTTLSFAAALRGAGVPVTLLYTPQYDHAGVNDAIGDTGDEVITPALTGFLETARPDLVCGSPRPRARRPSRSVRPTR